MKRLATLIVLAALPSIALADNVGQCGWGSKLMDGNRGIAPQVLAVTTNGTFGNQTFGITSGTSGCTQDGVVKSSWKLAAFVDENRTRLAHDVAAGRGESVDALAALVGVKSEDRARFNEVARANFDAIFPSTDVSGANVVASLKGVLAADQSLRQYAEVL